MSHEVLCPMIFGIVGGLAIFLLGMKNMSEGMQAIAGSKLRKMISAVTDNRLLACGTGTVVTSLIQSSSVTTVMLVGMVNAGVMTLIQALGVVLGADIGTTITAWIVSLDVIEYGLPLLGISGFFFLFTKNERVRYSAMMVMGIGMVFFGLCLMKEGLHPLRSNESVIGWFSEFQPDDFPGLIACILVGAVVTAIVQSSSATVAITITLARAGMIEYDQAVALVLGQNIGTTITAYLASLGASTNAKRVAYGHILMKVIAVAIMLLAFGVYMKFLQSIIPPETDIAKKIAFAHTIFNVILVVVFLPLIGPFAKLLTKIAPDAPHKEPPHLTFLDIRLLDTPAFGIQQSADEILRMSDGVTKMFEWLKDEFDDKERNEEREKHMFHREEVLDIMQREIVEFLGHLLSGNVPRDVMDETRKQLRIADEYESVSDYLVTLFKLSLKMRNLNMDLPSEGVTHINDLHQRLTDYSSMITEAVKENNESILSKAVTQGEAITHLIKDYRTAHLERIENKHVPPQNNLLYVDMLAAYRKIKDHYLNIAEALAGEK